MVGVGLLKYDRCAWGRGKIVRDSLVDIRCNGGVECIKITGAHLWDVDLVGRRKIERRPQRLVWSKGGFEIDASMIG